MNRSHPPPRSTASSDSPEALPFQVRVAASAEDHSAVCAVRAAAYARHSYTPEVQARLRELDDVDRNSVLLMAENKQTGSVLGTIRLQSTAPVTVFPCEHLAEVGQDSFLYVDRFAVAQCCASDVVALALIKAQWYWAHNQGLLWILGAALAPLARRYSMVGLRRLRGTDLGFHVTGIHPGQYFSMGERLVDMPTNMLQVAPFLAPFFSAQHPDILLEHPPGIDQGFHPKKHKTSPVL